MCTYIKKMIVLVTIFQIVGVIKNKLMNHLFVESVRKIATFMGPSVSFGETLLVLSVEVAVHLGFVGL